jgi:hypothetical protein
MSFIDPLEEFLNLSTILTGFNKVELQGAGVGREYLNLLVRAAGDKFCFEMWGLIRNIFAAHPDLHERERAVEATFLHDPKYQPISRNIMLLWYSAIWYQLPPEWTALYGANALDQDQVVSATAYSEALIWKTFHAHPPAAKPQGFAAWALPPVAASGAKA